MKPFAALLVILGVIPIALTLVQKGVFTTAQSAGLLVFVVLAVAVSGKFIRIALPIFGILLFATYNYQSDPQLEGLLVGLLALFIMLIGLYVIFRGAFGRKD